MAASGMTWKVETFLLVVSVKLIYNNSASPLNSLQEI
jgi:hypothetical protein